MYTNIYLGLFLLGMHYNVNNEKMFILTPINHNQ